ncbi:hypothetical protein FAM22021_002339 [Propionibacterium freudenreichii]|nr:hypothetical protein [Propionibacterium freudenreichii]
MPRWRRLTSWPSRSWDANPASPGAALLSTCNRYELIVDATDAVDPDRLLGLAKAGIRELAPDVDPRALAGLEVRSDDTAICNLFEVGAGLCSAVVGDKQVAGQLRRAYELASDRGQCTARLHRLFHDCLRVSRTVASSTSLGAVGRSAAGVGLDLAMGRGGLRGARVLLMGTGSFARVVGRRAHRPTGRRDRVLVGIGTRRGIRRTPSGDAGAVRWLGPGVAIGRPGDHLLRQRGGAQWCRAVGRTSGTGAQRRPAAVGDRPVAGRRCRRGRRRTAGRAPGATR